MDEEEEWSSIENSILLIMTRVNNRNRSIYIVLDIWEIGKLKIGLSSRELLDLLSLITLWRMEDEEIDQETNRVKIDIEANRCCW